MRDLHVRDADVQSKTSCGCRGSCAVRAAPCQALGKRRPRRAAVGFSDWAVSSQQPDAGLRRWSRGPPAALRPAPPLLQPGTFRPVSVPECRVMPSLMAVPRAVIGVRFFHLMTYLTKSPPSSHSLHSGLEHWMFPLMLFTFTALSYSGDLRTIKKKIGEFA